MDLRLSSFTSKLMLVVAVSAARAEATRLRQQLQAAEKVSAAEQERAAGLACVRFRLCGRTTSLTRTPSLSALLRPTDPRLRCFAKSRQQQASHAEQLARQGR